MSRMDEPKRYLSGAEGGGGSRGEGSADDPTLLSRGGEGGGRGGGGTDGPTRTDSSGPSGGGRRIGPCRIVRVLGEGGMSVVYEALQEKPVRRRVALKLIRPGSDSKSVVARFESERQALALMSQASARNSRRREQAK